MGWLRFVIAAGVLVAALPPVHAQVVAPVWERAGPEAPVAGEVRETRWTLDRNAGADTSDRIAVHRYRVGDASRAALLYLPGTYMNGELSGNDARHDLWLHLASAGVEVWAVDYRTHFVSDADAAPGAHGFMRDWTLDRFVDDARSAAQLARRQSGHPRIFVAGFSRGATLAFGVACSEPEGTVAGLIVLDGPFKSAAGAGEESFSEFDFEAERRRLFDAGRASNDVAHGIGWARRQRLMRAAVGDPTGPPLAPAPEGSESVGAQVAALLYDAWRPGALADPVHGFSRVEVLARLLQGYDRYWPAVQNLEGRRIAAVRDDPHTAIDDRWGELSLPVLYFGATNMGAEWILDGVYSVVRSGSEDVTLHVLEGYGHLDVLVGERAHDEVHGPTSRWILDRSP